MWPLGWKGCSSTLSPSLRLSLSLPSFDELALGIISHWPMRHTFELQQLRWQGCSQENTDQGGGDCYKQWWFDSYHKVGKQFLLDRKTLRNTAGKKEWLVLNLHRSARLQAGSGWEGATMVSYKLSTRANTSNAGQIGWIPHQLGWSAMLSWRGI